jgi:hypothetical protein
MLSYWFKSDVIEGCVSGEDVARRWLREGGCADFWSKYLQEGA